MVYELSFIPGETFQEVINDVTAVRVAKQSGLGKQVLEVGKAVVYIFRCFSANECKMTQLLSLALSKG